MPIDHVHAQHIVAREPGQRASHRQLARNAVACGRVNSTVGFLSLLDETAAHFDGRRDRG